jgi:hypothetical protein
MPTITDDFMKEMLAKTRGYCLVIAVESEVTSDSKVSGLKT